MSTHELVLLSPYRFPAQYAMSMSDEDMACWLNGFTALWHPAIAWQAKSAPRVEATYDHESPKPGFIYALPEAPPAYLPDDWNDRVRQVGAITFKVTPDRETTLANLKAALNAEGAPVVGWNVGLDLAPADLGPFFGSAWGHQLLAALSEAMEHENLLDQAAFWSDVQQAIASLGKLPFTPEAPANPTPPAPEYAESSPDEYSEGASTDASGAPAPEETTAASVPAPPLPTDWREPLRSAAAKLLSAREVLYPVAIHLLDVSFLDQGSFERGLPASFQHGLAVNFIADTITLEKLAQQDPAKFAELRTAVVNDKAEVCGGCYIEREDPILPIDSQLWNLRHGLDRAKELLGADIRVYARKRFGYHPHLPLFLSSNGLVKALFLTFDENSGLPNYANIVVSWPSPDGKQVDAFARQPKYTDAVETFFNLGHTWFKTTREDHTATIFLLHRNQGPPAPLGQYDARSESATDSATQDDGEALASPTPFPPPGESSRKDTCIWYDDLMELAKLAPVLGEWTTFSRYLTNVMPGEYPSLVTADDFHFDFLSERIAARSEEPVSAFPRHLRTRRRIDACWTYAALHRALSGKGDALQIETALREVEKQAECSLAIPAGLDDLEKRITGALAERLQSRAELNRPGYMILNPCGFARRAALELEAGRHPLPIEGIVKACQLDQGKLRAVIEIPALGFAWLPREGPPGTPPMTTKMRVADEQSHTIRNDFFEVEVDAGTGGLKVIRDHKTRINRLGQMLVFNPGSRMVAKDIKVTSTGPALAEIVSEGALIGEQNQTLASYRQRLRLWWGRPLLEMRIELMPQQPPAGYGWHAYYGARFAWRDERATFIRGFNGVSYITNHPRPQTPDYLDIRLGPNNTTIFTAGLPFHQKQGGRMVDVILIPEGEKATTFELGIAFDREVPSQTAWGFASPLAIVPTTKGPPHVGSSGWLFHIDAANLLLTRMMPGKLEPASANGQVDDAITARFLECANYSGLAELRCVRDPQRATVLDARGHFLLEANRSGDAVHLEVTPNDLAHVQVEFSVPPAEPEAPSEPDA